MNFSLPQNIYSIISIINNGGFKAHVVGGCVRDMISNRIPKDWDITTNAPPDSVKALFQKTYDTGLKHGTVTVNYEDSLVEVTTWRKETHYTDHRHPDHVNFTESLPDDLARRDFTMNAIAYHPVEGLVDPFNGLKDIKQGIIRCVGDPYVRFTEDALRMLRAVRFSAQLGFKIEKKTYQAITALSQDLSYVSMERIQVEINKILESPSPNNLRFLWETGLAKTIFPEIPAISSNWVNLSPTISMWDTPKIPLLSLLFILSFDIDPILSSRGILNRLKYDGKTIQGITQLIKSFQDLKIYSERNIRKLFFDYGESVTRSCLHLRLLSGTSNTWMSSQNELLRSFLNKNLVPIKLALAGADLERSGLFVGKAIGTTLTALSLCVCERTDINDYETLFIISRIIKDKFP